MINRLNSGKNLRKVKLKLTATPKLVILQKMVFVASMFFFASTISGIVYYFQFGQLSPLTATVAGDYRSVASGNWSSASTWEKYNGTGWVAATTSPTSGDGAIEIQSGHTVTVTANVTADQVTVDAAGSLTVASGKTLTIAAGTGTDLDVNGTITINGSLSESASTATLIGGTAILSSGGSNSFGAGATIVINSGGRYRADDNSITTTAGIWTINSGGTYQQNFDGGNIPLATWNTESTCEITGVVSSIPGNFGQSFYHFTYNSPNQTTIEKLSGLLTTIAGDFNFISSGTGTIRIGQQENYTLNIGRNLNIQGGKLALTCKATNVVVNITGNLTQTGGTFLGSDVVTENGSGDPVINITGNYIMSGGTFDMNQNNTTTAGNGITTLNLTGDFIQTGGTITETATTAASYGYGSIFFAKTGAQSFTKSAGTISNTIHFTVNNGAVLDLGTNYPSGAGNFTVASGGGLRIGSPNGITLSSASGNVQVTGTRSYSTGGDYTYNGSSAQVTGNGLPSTVRNLTFNNSSGTTLTSSTSISNALTFTSGNLVTSNDTLTLGSSMAILGTLSTTNGYVVGTFRRWVAATTANNILFPIGTSTDYKGANISFTTAPTIGGTITTSFKVANLNTNGNNFEDVSDSIQALGNGYWETANTDGLSGGTFNLDVTATNLFGVSNYHSLHLIKRNNSSAAWGSQGNHVATTGSNSVPVLHRTGLTSFVHFGIGSPHANNVLPIELEDFNVKLNDDHVDISWTTASESNNDYFTIERTSDQRNFQEVFRKRGSGNSTERLSYSGTDNKPMQGYSYYRLKQTDFNGHVSYSRVRAVNYNSAPATSIVITSAAPNPFTDKVRIFFTLKANGARVDCQMINSQGQIVYRDVIIPVEGMTQYEYELEDKNGLPPGIYFVNLQYNHEQVTQKLIKK